MLDILLTTALNTPLASTPGCEKKFLSSDLVYNFKIEKFDSKLILYRIIYNGSPDKFLNDFNDDNFKVDTSSSVWKIK